MHLRVNVCDLLFLCKSYVLCGSDRGCECGIEKGSDAVDEKRIRLNRRRFLVGASASAGAAILAACGSSDVVIPTPTTGATGATTGTTASGVPTTAPTFSSAPVLANATAAPATAAPTAAAAASSAGAPAASPAASAAASMSTSAAPGMMTGPVKSQIDPTKIKKGGTLIEGGTSDVRTFNPVLSSDTTSGLLIGLMYDALVDIDPDTLQPVPNLATKWDVLDGW